VDLLPADIDQLANPQGMPEGHQDQQPEHVKSQIWDLAAGTVPSPSRSFAARLSSSLALFTYRMLNRDSHPSSQVFLDRSACGYSICVRIDRSQARTALRSAIASAV
jgi:hypothetical protein